MLRFVGHDGLDMKNKVVDRDLGWKRIQRDLEDLGKKSVEVGIQSDAGIDKEGNPIIERAVTNEFGDPKQRIPERSFVRSSFDEKQGELADITSKLTGAVIDGKMTPNEAAVLLGQKHENDIREKITTLSTPPNSPYTIAQKGSSNPLIDTDQMRASVRYEVK